MNHAGHMGINMAGSPVTTATATPTASAKSMGGMGGGSGCKISMLFNLYTIDSCFLSSQWRITSHAAFAGSCIGVFLLTLSLEMLRRCIKEYDRYLVRQHRARHQPVCFASGHATPPSPGKQPAAAAAAAAAVASTTTIVSNVVPPFRPSAAQQAVRALLHLLAFFVGYILMLLAMYYNGYILLCIFLGAFVGAFVFQWETLLPGSESTSAAQETTICCG
ncbi:hypothetical protein E4U42_008057 [Claviceps africana]|uniref:Copper transport protein n=1 Tax=Claviceps africana TaxID=83212 RepID=A0A8K0J115_9HYPO|nr:hypothetical protein E4U42_008057 [Claviceps africana]